MSKDTIYRQEAIDAMCKLMNSWFGNSKDEQEEITWIINHLPSAQPKIILCKDCKHRPVDSEDTQGFGVEFPDEKCPCQCEDGWYNWRPDDEWFCANAERRTDEQIC